MPDSSVHIVHEKQSQVQDNTQNQSQQLHTAQKNWNNTSTNVSDIINAVTEQK
jgi:hypothetical protein